MKSKVYFIEASLDEGFEAVSQKAVKLFKTGKFASCFKKDDFTAVKVHVGEKDNTTYIRPGCFKGLIDVYNGAFCPRNTLSMSLGLLTAAATAWRSFGLFQGGVSVRKQI